MSILQSSRDEREMYAALETGRIQECRGCERPRYRADSLLVLSEVEIDACLCRCDCEFVPDVDMGHPGYLPFLSNNVDWTPRPWLQRWLERQGFCNINSQTQRWQNQIVSGTFLPTFRSIVDRSYITEMETTNDSLLPLGEDRRSNVFPNGVERDLTTGSGLPAVLDSVIRSLDPDAFAVMRQHELCRLANSMEDGADISSLPIDQQNAIFRFRLLTNDNPAARRHGPTNFRVWLIQHEDDFTDNDSICTVDDLDIDRNEYLASMTREERGAHRRRHITRRFTDMARQGGYYTTASIIQAAARIEFDLESFLHSRVGGSDPQDVFQGSLLENGTPAYEASDLGQDSESDGLENDGDDTYIDALLDGDDGESVDTDSDDEGMHGTHWVNYEGFNFSLPRLQEVATTLRQNQIEVPDHMQRLITQMQQMETSTAESLTQTDHRQSQAHHSSNDLNDDMSEAGSDCDSLAEDDVMSDADVEVTPAVADLRRMYLRGLVARLGIEETEGLQVQLHDHTPHGVLEDLGPDLAFTWHDHRNATPPLPLVEVTVRYEPAPGAHGFNNVLHTPNALSAQDPEADENNRAQQAPESES